MADNRVLIIGQGSIGRRHSMVASELGYQVATVSRRDGLGDYAAIGAALSDFDPTAVVVASATADHKPDWQALREAGYDGPVLMEKPLFAGYDEARGLTDDGVWVGYNLRFNPALQRLHALLQTLDEPVVAAQFLVGQYLPDWRPGRDWRTSYSAAADQGGGVLRDLSHELDMALLLFGPWERLTALGGAVSELPMDADDVWQITAVSSRCPVLSLHLNCLDRVPVRQIRVTCSHTSLFADLIEGRVLVNGDAENLPPVERSSYHDQMRAFIEGDRDGQLCGLDEARNVLEMIEAVEQSARQSCWLRREAG